MTTQATTRFSIKSWDEKTWEGKPAAEVTGRKLTRAVVEYSYKGDIEGESTLQYIMTYNEDGTGNFVALEKVTGSVGGKKGSFVLQHVGTFDNDKVNTELSVMPGSGTDELAGLSGQSSVEIAGHHDDYPLTLSYTLPG